MPQRLAPRRRSARSGPACTSADHRTLRKRKLASGRRSGRHVHPCTSNDGAQRPRLRRLGLIPSPLVGIRPSRYTRSEPWTTCTATTSSSTTGGPTTSASLEDADRDLRGREPAVRRPDHDAARRRRRRRATRSGSPAGAARSARRRRSLLTDEIKGKPVDDVAGRGRRTCSTCSASRSAPRASSARCSASTPSSTCSTSVGAEAARPQQEADADGPLRVSPAGLSRHPDRLRDAVVTPAGADLPSSTRPAATGSPSIIGAPIPPMPKTYADLLREARAEIREVSPAETDALRQRGGVALIDVREASEWEQGHVPGADPRLQELPRAADRGRGARPRRARRPVLRRRRALAVRGPDARRDGLHRRRVDDRRLPGLEDPGPRVDARRSA